MGLIYTNSTQVVPYKIFGVRMYAVEHASIDYENCSVLRENLGWFYDPVAASNYANSVLEGDVE